MFFRRVLPTITLLLVATAAHAQTTVRYADRTIDLAPYVPRNAILAYRVQQGISAVFIRQRVNGAIRLRMLPFSELREDQAVDITRAQDPFGATDYAKQIAVPRPDTLSGTWIMRADTANDEHFDLFEARDGNVTARRLTSNGRVWAVFPQGGKVVFSHQIGDREPYPTCLTLLDTKSLRQQTVLCTDSSTRFTPAVTWTHDAKAFAQPVRRGSKHALVILTLTGDSAVKREQTLDLARANLQIAHWAHPDRIRVIAERDSARDLFDVDVVSGTITRVTNFGKRVQIQGTQRVDGRELAIVRAMENQQIRLTAYAVPETKSLGSILLPPNTNAPPSGGAHWLLEDRSAAIPTRYSLLRLRMHGDSAVFKTLPLPGGTPEPQACDSDTLNYKTHDGRIVKGILRTPRNPLPNPADRLAIVYAYYGGDNSYDVLTSVWCQAGVASLSPDIDRDTDGDRGGNEVADVLVGARFLRERLGLKERQIGVFGMSQGGYNAMRALTFQPETNKLNLSFDFGFGIAQAGYSSMVTIFENTNTESPQIIATGNPWTEEGRARLRERSPLDQVHRLNAPLLLIHGTNDFRVRMRESVQMFEAGRALGKDVQLVELVGEGHGVAGEANLLKYYRAQLEFLERVRRRR